MPQIRTPGISGKGTTPRAAARKTHPHERIQLFRNAAGDMLPAKAFRAFALRHAAPLFDSGGPHGGRPAPEAGLFRRRRCTGRILADGPDAGTPCFPALVPKSHDRHRAPCRTKKHFPSKNVDALPPKIREERVFCRKGRRTVRLRRVSLSGPTSFYACRPGVPEPPQAYPSSWQSAGGCTGFPVP